jgi:hypothetical protein
MYQLEKYISRSKMVKATQDDLTALTTLNCPIAGASSNVKHILWRIDCDMR